MVLSVFDSFSMSDMSLKPKSPLDIKSIRRANNKQIYYKKQQISPKTKNIIFDPEKVDSTSEIDIISSKIKLYIDIIALYIKKNFVFFHELYLGLEDGKSKPRKRIHALRKLSRCKSWCSKLLSFISGLLEKLPESVLKSGNFLVSFDLAKRELDALNCVFEGLKNHVAHSYKASFDIFSAAAKKLIKLHEEIITSPNYKNECIASLIYIFPYLEHWLSDPSFTPSHPLFNTTKNSFLSLQKSSLKISENAPKPLSSALSAILSKLNYLFTPKSESPLTKTQNWSDFKKSQKPEFPLAQILSLKTVAIFGLKPNPQNALSKMSGLALLYANKMRKSVLSKSLRLDQLCEDFLTKKQSTAILSGEKTNVFESIMRDLMCAFEALDSVLSNAEESSAELLMDALSFERTRLMLLRHVVISTDMQCDYNKEANGELRLRLASLKSNDDAFMEEILLWPRTEEAPKRKAFAHDIEELFLKINSELLELVDVLGGRDRGYLKRVDFWEKYFRCFRCYYSAESFLRKKLFDESAFLYNSVLTRIDSLREKSDFDEEICSEKKLLALKNSALKKLSISRISTFTTMCKGKADGSDFYGTGETFLKRYLKYGSGVGVVEANSLLQNTPRFSLVYPKPILLDLALEGFREDLLDLCSEC